MTNKDMTNKDCNAAAEHEGRVNWLVSLRACIIEAQAELSALSIRPAPADPSALVEIEIQAATLEVKIDRLTQEYREALLAHVHANEDGQ